MLYSPRLKDGSLVRLPWPVTLYKYFNHICWPLEDNVSNFYIYLDRCAIYIGFLIFCLHNEVDFHYVIHHRHDLDKMLEGMPTYLILVEIQIRGFQLAFTKQQFKRLLQQFYAQIYVTAQSEPTLYKLIQKQMLAMRLNSINYLLALLNYFMVPVWNIIYHRRDMLYKQVYLFDNTVLYFYIPLLICNYWVGFIIDSMLFGELNVIGELMMHLNARYVLLSRDLQQLAQRCLAKQRHSVNLAVDLQLQLRQLLRRHIALNAFAARMEPLYEDIQRQMQPTRFNSLNYLAALLNFGFVPVLNIIYNRREMLYKQVYLFDNTVWYFYYPLIACNYWVGIVIDSMLFGELNVLGEFMMHLNARYIILSRDLESLAARCITKNKQRQHLAYEFKLELKQLLRRHFELTAFVASIEKEFSLRIFFSFSFSTGLLCALGFKAYTNPLGSLVYIFWFAAKFFELLAFGMLGSTLQKTTDNLSTMYYSCGWEQIMYHSPNEQENVLMMKLVKQAVQINATPVSLSGLNYFHVTLEAVVT
ncbi:Or74a, partial [Drosophila busckii]